MAEKKEEKKEEGSLFGGGGGFTFGDTSSAFGSGFGGGGSLFGGGGESSFGTGTGTTESKDEPEEVVQGKDPDFKPLVQLEEVEVKSGEEDEEEMFSMRAKLFRFVAETKEFKERGVGNVKLLKHKKTKKIRLLMRRDKTLKLCANHYVLPELELKKNSTSVRSWVWSTPADYSEEEPKSELLAIRFANAEIWFTDAGKFKAAFEKAQAEMGETSKEGDGEVKEVTEKLADVKVEEKKEEEEKAEKKE